MTATRDPDRLLRAWLDLMPTEAPDRAIAAALQAAETTRQLRALPRIGRWRFPMNRLTLIAAAALVLAALVGGTYLLVGRPSGPAVPTPSALAPTAAPPTTAPTDAAAIAMPDLFWGDWHADGVAIPGVSSAQLVRLSIDWQDGRSVWVQLDGDGQGRQVLQSTPVREGPEGRITFRSDPGNTGCSAGDTGQYIPHRTADGLFMWLEVMGDECRARADVFTRTWVHSLSAVNDGGVGVFPANPWLKVTMPTMRLAMSGGTDAADIHTFNDGDPFKSLIVVTDPMGFQAPCATDKRPFAIKHTAAEFETYLRTLPGLQIAKKTAVVGGASGLAFEATGVADSACTATDIGLIRSRVSTETEAEWTFKVGDHLFLWTIARAGHLWVFAYQGDGATQAEAQAIIDSVEFLDKLPTKPAS